MAGADDEGLDASDDDEEEGPKSRTGRFSLSHRGGARVEVGEPIHIATATGIDRPWLCAVKLVGPAEQQAQDAADTGEPTQTLLVRTGRGNSPEEAQRDALAQLSLVYGTPAGPPPAVIITKKPSTAPPPPPEPPKKSFWAWVGKLFGRSES